MDKGALFGRSGHCAFLHTLTNGVELPQANVITQTCAKVEVASSTPPRKPETLPTHVSTTPERVVGRKLPHLPPGLAGQLVDAVLGASLTGSLPSFFLADWGSAVTHCFSPGSGP